MKYKLSELSSYVTEKILVSELQEYQYISTDNMVLNRGGIIPTKYFPQLGKVASFKKGDILISNIRPYFKKIWLASFNGGCSNDVLVIRANSKIDNNFLYYVLSSDDFFDYVTATSKDGTKMPRGDRVAVMKYQVPNFSLETQQKIAKILSSLDEKIELNNKINENLHAQAQAIFKSWFVNFEPFGGTMPSDWEKGKLSDVADITMGQSPKGESYNEIGDGEVFYQGKADFAERFPVRRLYTTEPKRMAEEKSVLLSVRAPVGEINVATEKCCIGRGLASIKSKNGQNSYLLYLLYSIQSQFDIFNGEGTVFGSINKSDLGNMNIVLPAQEKISQFEKIASQLDEMILTNWNENQKLAQIRDTLLPKLMSGELEV